MLQRYDSIDKNCPKPNEFKVSVSSQVIRVVHRSMADGRHGVLYPPALLLVVLAFKHVFANATILRMVIILVSHKEITLILGLRMVVLHAMAIILNCRHAIWKNAQLGPVIGDIQSAKNTGSGRVKHCSPQQFQVEQQTNACYTVESQVKALTIQTVMSQLVRFRWNDCMLSDQMS